MCVPYTFIIFAQLRQRNERSERNSEQGALGLTGVYSFVNGAHKKYIYPARLYSTVHI